MFVTGMIAGGGLSTALVGHVAAAEFVFGGLGDTPYNAEGESGFIGVIAELNHEPLAFVVHVGDFWNRHGDSYRFRFDRPLKDPRSGRRIGNFSRMEVFGSPDVN